MLTESASEMTFDHPSNPAGWFDVLSEMSRGYSPELLLVLCLVYAFFVLRKIALGVQGRLAEMPGVSEPDKVDFHHEQLTGRKSSKSLRKFYKIIEVFNNITSFSINFGKLTACVAVGIFAASGVGDRVQPTDTLPPEPAETLSPEEGYKSAKDSFEGAMEEARAALEGGDAHKAKRFYSEALSEPEVLMKDGIRAMAGLAKLWVEEGRYDEARPLAQIAARLDKEKAEYVNIYAEILINDCELEGAIDILRNLDGVQDVRTEKLMIVAHDSDVRCDTKEP